MLFADDIGLCSTRSEQVKGKVEEWKRATEERGLKIIRKKTEYLGYSEHQDADIHLWGEALKRVKTIHIPGVDVGGGWITGRGNHPHSAQSVGELEESVGSVEHRRSQNFFWVGAPGRRHPALHRSCMRLKLSRAAGDL